MVISGEGQLEYLYKKKRHELELLLHIYIDVYLTYILNNSIG